MFGCRADKGHLVLFQNIGETGILGQKSIARMNRFGTGDFTRGDKRRYVEIAFCRRWRADTDTFVCQANMHGVLVSR